MARSWNGFVAQNQEVKEQWGILEKCRREIEMRQKGLIDHDPSPDDSDLGKDRKLVIQVR